MGETQVVFGIDTTIVRFNRSVFFVPDHAAHRPVARNTLERRTVSPRLHKLVRRVMERRPGSMVHAGAFFGDMLPSFSRKTPGTVYAFEPVIESYLLARAVIEANHLGNVLLLHAALGPTVGTVTVATAREEHFGGAAHVVTAPDPEVTTQLSPMLTIDQFAIDDLVMVQLDAEGFEGQILEGGIESIRARRPVIVVEDNKKTCRTLLAELDYAYVTRLGWNHVYVPVAEEAEFADLAE